MAAEQSRARSFGELFLAEDDAALGEVVGGELDLHAVAGQDADEVLAHLPGDDPQDLVVGIVQPQLEHRVRQRGGDGRFDFDRLRFGHSTLPYSGRPPAARGFDAHSADRTRDKQYGLLYLPSL